MDRPFSTFAMGISLVVLGATGCALFAQQAAQPAQPVSQALAAGSTGGQGGKRAAFAAYSADQVSVTTQTLADGTKITRRSLTKFYQDSQGRRREERFGSRAESPGPDDSPLSIYILDPVARVRYYLSPGDHTARRVELRKPTPSSTAASAGASANTGQTPPALPRIMREDLGTQTIEGLEAKGVRFTRTIPEGAEGNDRPIQITTESWTAATASGHIELLSILNDPRQGETETRVSNLVLEEPPAELFQVPADYTFQELQPVVRPEPPSD